jgi:hypothetical protein
MLPTMLDVTDDGPASVLFVTESEMSAIIIQMGHDTRDSLKEYCSDEGRFFSRLYGKAVTRVRHLCILRYLWFSYSKNALDKVTRTKTD